MTQQPSLITIQGSARGGKGTLTKALTRDLSSEYRIYTIDQGLKFRVMAALALEAGVDKEDLAALTAFITQKETHRRVVDALLEAAQLDKPAYEARYYTQSISNASGMVGKLSAAHEIVGELLYEEVAQLVESSPEIDLIIVDGRTLQDYGRELEARGLVRYLLAIDVHCDAFVSAQRETKIFSPEDNELDSYTREQAIQLLVATRDIARRNTSDARRRTLPSLPIRGAYDFDVLRPLPDGKKDMVYEEIRANGAVTIDNSNTKTIKSLTDPVVELVRYLVVGPTQ